MSKTRKFDRYAGLPASEADRRRDPKWVAARLREKQLAGEYHETVRSSGFAQRVYGAHFGLGMSGQRGKKQG